MGNITDFYKTCQEISEKIQTECKGKVIHVFTHHDADGITAGSILANSLDRIGINFQLKVLERVDHDFIRNLKQSIPKNVPLIFSDLATGIIGDFQEWNQNEIFILDHHHLPDPIPDLPTNVHLVNPHIHQIDGSVLISGSGVVYEVMSLIDENLKQLAPLAVIGALGDRQDQGDNGKLIGLNRKIVKDAIDEKLLSEVKKPWFYDRSRPVVDILKYQNIQSLSNEKQVFTFLKSLNIQPMNNNLRRTFYDLSDKEQRIIISELISSYGVSQDEVIKYDYKLLGNLSNFESDARVFASRLNATGRLKRYDIGIALCFGDSSIYTEMMNLKREYSKLIHEGISLIRSGNILKEFERLIVIEGGYQIKEQLIAPITSIISSNVDITKGKTLLGWSYSEKDRIKISVRLPKTVKNGINLAKILKEVVFSIDPESEVGGHNAAAGAMIEKKDLHSIIQSLSDSLIKIEKENNGVN